MKKRLIESDENGKKESKQEIHDYSAARDRQVFG